MSFFFIVTIISLSLCLSHTLCLSLSFHNFVSLSLSVFFTLTKNTKPHMLFCSISVCYLYIYLTHHTYKYTCLLLVSFNLLTCSFVCPNSFYDAFTKGIINKSKKYEINKKPPTTKAHTRHTIFQSSIASVNAMKTSNLFSFSFDLISFNLRFVLFWFQMKVRTMHTLLYTPGLLCRQNMSTPSINLNPSSCYYSFSHIHINTHTYTHTPAHTRTRKCSIQTFHTCI